MNTQPNQKKKYDRMGEPVTHAVVLEALKAFKAAVEAVQKLDDVMRADQFDKQYEIDGGKMGLDGASFAIKWAGRALTAYNDPRVPKTKIAAKTKTK
jgi:hypothetical protein